MRGKLLLLVGFAAGYVLGARAGRARYEQIKRAAKRLWEDPRVQGQVKNVEDFAKDKAPEVVDFISDNAKKLVGRRSEEASAASGGGSKSKAASRAQTGPKSTGGSGSSAAKK